MSARDGGFIIYPSGFAVHCPDTSGISTEENDSVVAALYTGVIDGGLDATLPDNFMNILNAGVRLLGSGVRWASIQRHNPNISRLQAEFVQDTLNYIQTGRRRMYPHTWLSLLDEPNKAHYKPIVLGGVPVHQQLAVPEEFTKGVPSQIIARWLAHEGGAVDMICALNIMFGGVPYVRGVPAPTL